MQTVKTRIFNVRKGETTRDRRENRSVLLWKQKTRPRKRKLIPTKIP